MPNRNRARGYELEAECRDFWLENGFDARRTFASGAYKHVLGREQTGDLYLEGLMVEAKRKKSGFKFLYDSLANDNAEVLVVRQDRSERLYCLPEKTMLKLMKMAHGKK